MTMPPPFIQGGLWHGATEALQEAVKQADRDPGPRLTRGRRREAQARPRGQMAAGGVAMPHLPQEELPGRDRRQHAVAPCGVPELPAHGQHGVGLQRRGPLAGNPLPDGGDVWNHRVTSSTMGLLTLIRIEDAWTILTSGRSQAIEHECG
jgi:hypothetical protein